MLRSALISLLLLFACIVARAQDSADYAALEKKLDAYVSSIASDPVAVKQKECDFLISSCRDDTIRSHVATYLYSRYLNSPLMGDESVAIYITDKWLIPGKASLPSSDDMMMARVYADFNRASQIGFQAPSLLLTTPDGSQTTLDFKQSGLKLLFIYDTSCSQCRTESTLLSALLPSCGHSLELVALYAGTDESSWLSYSHKRLPPEDASLKVSHYWDPSSESGFQQKYGVLSTPKMFLIGDGGIILGRNLNTRSLLELLDALDSPYSYGEPESMDLLEGIFKGQDADGMIASAKYLSSRGASRDSTMWRHVTGDMLYFFSGRRGEASHAAAAWVADSLVLARPSAWKGDDTLTVLPLAKLISGLAGLSPVGTVVPSLKLPGTKIEKGNAKSGSWKLDKLKGEPSIIVFRVDGCASCKAESAALEALSRQAVNKKTVFFFVDMDALTEEQKEAVTEKFDLTTAPFILSTDKKGVILKKYLSFTENSEQ